MGKHKHSKDRMFITASEHKAEWGGYKDKAKIPIAKLPFNSCSLSMLPFENPVCTIEGTVFDIVNIIPFLKKYKKNPVTGQPLKMSELIKLNFHRNDKNQYHDPVSFKVFTDFTKIVAIKTSGNVFTFDTVEELNKKPKFYQDLISGEAFTYKDIIVLQDPTNLEKRTVKDFDFIKNDLTFQVQDKKINDQINQSGTARRILSDLQNHKTIQLQEEKMVKKVKYDDDVDSTNYFVTERLEKKDLIHDRFTINKVAGSVTSTALDVTLDNQLRNLSEDEIRQMIYDKIAKMKQKGYVTMVTNFGNINIELHTDITPMTCENFIELCEKRFYDNVKFHRLVQHFCLQGGDPSGTGKGGQSIFDGPFKDEFNLKLKHDKAGVLSMANKGPDTNTSQFFFTLNDCTELNGKHTVFGKVSEGMIILDKVNTIDVDVHERPKLDIIILETKVLFNPFREFIKQFRAEKQSNQKIAKISQNQATELIKDIFKPKEKEEQGLAGLLNMEW